MVKVENILFMSVVMTNDVQKQTMIFQFFKVPQSIHPWGTCHGKPPLTVVEEIAFFVYTITPWNTSLVLLLSILWTISIMSDDPICLNTAW
jgi:hypothetical protein